MSFLNNPLERDSSGAVKTSVTGMTIEIGEGVFENASTRDKQNEMIDILTGILESVDTVKGKLTITGNISATTVLDTDSNGSNFTKTGDSVYLGADETEFNDNNELKFFLNGLLKEKGEDIIFVTEYSFYINEDLDNGDKIIIVKGV